MHHGNSFGQTIGGAGLTGITDPFGRVMRDELMTTWLNPKSFISKMTVASFRHSSRCYQTYLGVFVSA